MPERITDKLKKIDKVLDLANTIFDDDSTTVTIKVSTKEEDKPKEGPTLYIQE